MEEALSSQSTWRWWCCSNSFWENTV